MSSDVSKGGLQLPPASSCEAPASPLSPEAAPLPVLVEQTADEGPLEAPPGESGAPEDFLNGPAEDKELLLPEACLDAPSLSFIAPRQDLSCPQGAPSQHPILQAEGPLWEEGALGKNALSSTSTATHLIEALSRLVLAEGPLLQEEEAAAETDCLSEASLAAARDSSKSVSPYFSGASTDASVARCPSHTPSSTRRSTLIRGLQRPPEARSTKPSRSPHVLLFPENTQHHWQRSPRVGAPSSFRDSGPFASPPGFESAATSAPNAHLSLLLKQLQFQHRALRGSRGPGLQQDPPAASTTQAEERAAGRGLGQQQLQQLSSQHLGTFVRSCLHPAAAQAAAETPFDEPRLFENLPSQTQPPPVVSCASSPPSFKSHRGPPLGRMALRERLASCVQLMLHQQVQQQQDHHQQLLLRQQELLQQQLQQLQRQQEMRQQQTRHQQHKPRGLPWRKGPREKSWVSPGGPSIQQSKRSPVCRQVVAAEPLSGGNMQAVKGVFDVLTAGNPSLAEAASRLSGGPQLQASPLMRAQEGASSDLPKGPSFEGQLQPAAAADLEAAAAITSGARDAARGRVAASRRDPQIHRGLQELSLPRRGHQRGQRSAHRSPNKGAPGLSPPGPREEPQEALWDLTRHSLLIKGPQQVALMMFDSMRERTRGWKPQPAPPFPPACSPFFLFEVLGGPPLASLVYGHPFLSLLNPTEPHLKGPMLCWRNQFEAVCWRSRGVPLR
ncbi:hypothetical protein Esti_001599 [Eimeria stiedai]